MSFSCRLVDDSNHNGRNKNGGHNPLVSLQDIEEQQQDDHDHDEHEHEHEERHDSRSCLIECDSWDDEEDDHHEKQEDHHEDDDDDDDDDDKDRNSLPQSSLLRGQSNGPMYLLQDPIVIGYAFGPKKMSTMGVVMAEASKAKVTTTATRPTAATSAAGTQRAVPSSSLSFQKIPDENHTVCTSASSVTSSVIASASAATPGTATTLLTWDALNSMMEPTTQTIFSIGCQDGGYGNDGIGSPTATTTTTNDLKHIVRYFQSSCSSAASATETTISTKTTLSAKTSSWTGNGRPQQHPYHQYPIRLSFVPLDLNVSLEEQQGGKFDLILHKLTEDILECSLMETNHNNLDQDRARQPPELSQPQQHVYENNSRSKSNENESSQRVERLQNYQRDHPECCMVDDPSHVQTLMSRSEIGRVLQQCLQGVTSTSGIPVCAPKFVECRLPPIAPSSLSSSTVTITCPSSPSGHVDSAATNSNNETTNARLLQTLADRLQEEQMHSFPLIAKPLIAAGTKQSHSMAVLLNPDALPLFLQHKVDQQQRQQSLQQQQQAQQQQQQQQHNFVLQEYVNHNAILYKVYVLGDTVKVYQRPSLPNLPTSEVKRSTTRTHTDHSDKNDSCFVNAKKGVFVEFDSQRPYPRLQDFGIDAVPSAATTTTTTAAVTTDATTASPQCSAKTSTLLGGATAPTAVTESEVLPIVNALKHAFGLELFGFDILVTAKEENQNADLSCDAITKTEVEEDGQTVDCGNDTTVRMLVIDVNYFPSYKEVPNFPSLLAHYLTQRVLQSREQQQLPKQPQIQQQTQDGE